ncbi:MAG: histidine phosphatase family protein [bacterium]|nr:histidine phosphatase family protein [bacterium]
MTIFYLIRHGNKKKQPGDYGLSELGKAQSERTAKHLKIFPIIAICTSPYARAQETAQIIARILNLPVIIEQSLKERMNWEKEYRSFEEFIQEWQYATDNPESKPKFGDSVKETAKRIDDIINKLADDSENGHIVLVTHGGTIRDFLVILSKEYSLKFAEKQMEGVRECSITKIVLSRKKIIVKYLDNVYHLKESS